MDRTVAQVLQVVLVDGVDLIALHVPLKQVCAVNRVLVPGSENGLASAEIGCWLACDASAARSMSLRCHSWCSRT